LLLAFFIKSVRLLSDSLSLSRASSACVCHPILHSAILPQRRPKNTKKMKTPAQRAAQISRHLATQPCAADGDKFLQGSNLMPGTYRALAKGIGFGEGPRIVQGTMVFSDMPAGKVQKISASGDLIEVVKEIPNGDAPSGLGCLKNGDLLIVGMNDKKVWRRPSGALGPSNIELKLHADLQPALNSLPDGGKGYFTNDAVSDAKGNFYVGVDPPIGKDPNAKGKLLLVKPDGSVSVACDDFPGLPNGVVITPDGKTMIAADSTSQCLRGFTINEDGALSNPRVWADLNGFSPDGICLDAENCVWVAAPFVARAKLEANNAVPKHFPRTKEGPRYSCFLRVAEGGEIKDVIENENQTAIACILGYFITNESAGKLFMVECNKVANGKPADLSNGRISVIHTKVGPAMRPNDNRYWAGYCT